MKNIALLSILLFFCLILTAQDKLPAFGKIDKTDFEITDCNFDPGAEAIALFDRGDLQFAFVDGVGWQSESEYHVRIKVLKSSGIHNSNIKIRYYTAGRHSLVSDLSAASYNIDGNGAVTEASLEKKRYLQKGYRHRNLGGFFCCT